MPTKHPALRQDEDYLVRGRYREVRMQLDATEAQGDLRWFMRDWVLTLGAATLAS